MVVVEKGRCAARGEAAVAGWAADSATQWPAATDGWVSPCQVATVTGTAPHGAVEFGGDARR